MMLLSLKIRRPVLVRWDIGLAVAVLCLLTACGGGSSAPPAQGPVIQQFTADRASYFVGDKATLTVAYSGGMGRIEPGIGPVASGTSIETPVLDQSQSFQLIVAGGGTTTSSSVALPVGFRDRYVTLDAPFGVSDHAAATAGDGSVLVIGGSRGGPTLSDSVDRFDPATRLFTHIGLLRTGRSGHTATRLPDGRILVAGGLTSLQIGNVADLIDERTGAISDGGTLVQTRFGHTATLLADGRVLVAGGLSRNTAEIWDPATNSWRLIAARMSRVRQDHTATLLSDGNVLIAGGSGISSGGFAELFNPLTETFEPVQSADDSPRILHAAHRLSDGSVLIAGGEVNLASGASMPLASVLRFDPSTRRIDVVAAPLASARTLARSVALPNDKVLLFGGETTFLVPTAGAEAYDLAQGGSALAPMPVERESHTVTRLPDGRLLIVGGTDAAQAFVPQVLLYE